MLAELGGGEAVRGWGLTHIYWAGDDFDLTVGGMLEWHKIIVGTGLRVMAWAASQGPSFALLHGGIALVFAVWPFLFLRPRVSGANVGR